MTCVVQVQSCARKPAVISNRSVRAGTLLVPDYRVVSWVRAGHRRCTERQCWTSERRIESNALMRMLRSGTRLGGPLPNGVPEEQIVIDLVTRSLALQLFTFPVAS